jgi:hypothetical protein
MMFTRTLTILPAAALFLGALFATTAAADLSGDLKVTIRGPDGDEMVQEGRIFLKGDADDKKRPSRVELGEGEDEVIFITRPDEDIGYMVMPPAQSYMRLDLEEAEGAGVGDDEVPEEEFTEVGRETVNGHPTTVKEAPIRDPAGEKIGTARVYFARDLNDEPIKSEMRMDDGTYTETLISNPSTEKLDEKLFTPPEDYAETLVPGLEQLFEGLEDELPAE